MKLSEATKLIQADIDDEDVDWDTPLGKAYKLSFEAVKRLGLTRTLHLVETEDLLPGETPE